MSPVPTQGVYDFDGEDYAANPNKYDDGVTKDSGSPLFGFQELLHDIPLMLAKVKRLREQLLQGVMYMHMTSTQTKDGRIYNAEKFERQVREMIE